MSENILGLNDIFSETFIAEDDSGHEIPRHVVRLKTSAWHDKSGLHFKKSLLTMRRLSRRGYQFFTEDVEQIGADEVISRIVNLDECNDGLYEIIIVNQVRDYESGEIKDYDYKLIPFVIDRVAQLS